VQNNSLALLKKSFKKALLTRLSEQAVQKEYFDNEMKTPVHLSIGAEAISAGVQACLPEPFQAFGTYRNHALYLSITEDTDTFFGELFGRVSGCARGKAGSMHMSAPEKGLIATSAVVGTTIPLAVGAAVANRIMKKNQQVVVFFGDGAVEEGVFWESINFACLQKLPVLFVCEDNHLAIHSHKHARQGFKALGDVVAGFDCYYDFGDGSELTDVIEKTQGMLNKMQANSKPGILHFEYFRFLEHVGPMEDFKFGYREKPEAAEAKHDPLIKAENKLVSMGVDALEIESWKSEFLSKIKQSMEKARRAPFPDPSELFTDVLTEEPATSNSQGLSH